MGFGAARRAVKLLLRGGDDLGWSAVRPRCGGVVHDLLQEGGELRARETPLGSDSPAFEVAGFEAGDDIRL